MKSICAMALGGRAFLTSSAILASVAGLFGVDSARSQVPGTITIFKSSLSTIKALEPYSQLPDEKSSLPGGTYPGIVDALDSSLREIFRPEFVPNRGFIDVNIRLLPANKGNRKEDMAFLPYGIGKKTFLIVMTGGRKGRMRVFIDDPNWGKLRTAGDAADRTKRVVGNYCVDPVGKRLFPRITSSIFKTNGSIFVAEIKADRRGRPERPPGSFGGDAWFFLGDSALCFCATNVFVWQGQPAREPEPNDWFSWTKDARTPQKEPPRRERQNESPQNPEKAADETPDLSR